jgi:hypothetical protein
MEVTSEMKKYDAKSVPVYISPREEEETKVEKSDESYTF